MWVNRKQSVGWKKEPDRTSGSIDFGLQLEKVQKNGSPESLAASN